MKTNKPTLHQWLFILAGLIFIVSILITAFLFNQANLISYPKLIADAYQENRHHLVVPGDTVVNLERKGAYGIYFEHDLTSSIYPEIEIPPAIECTLTSQADGAVIKAVPDFVKTNRYTSKDLHAGVLIMSITVDDPGRYSFACDYKDGRTEPEIRVALGPNYFWEFLRVLWKISLPLLASGTILCGFLPLALLLLITGIIIKQHSVNNLKTGN